VEHWWNDTDDEDPKYLEKDLLQCHFFHPKSQEIYWDRSQDSAARGRCLIAGAIGGLVQPVYSISKLISLLTIIWRHCSILLTKCVNSSIYVFQMSSRKYTTGQDILILSSHLTRNFFENYGVCQRFC